jgi:uncharacterized protein with ATP-grasp and redox domains
MFTRFRAVLKLWREYDETVQKLSQDRADVEVQKLLNQTLTAMAAQNAEGVKRLVAEYTRAADVWQDEIARANETSLEDAKMIRALLKWCEKRGCMPTREDLKEFM